jgi:hypothetical protein
MEPRDRTSTDQDKYAGEGDATSVDPQAGPQASPSGDTGEVVGDRLDDKHSGQDDLVGDEALSEPVGEPGMPTPNPGPGGSTP